MGLKAFDKEGNEIKRGDEITDFRGDRATFVMATRESGSRSGKVVVKWDKNGQQYEYYDSVFDLKVKEVPAEEGLYAKEEDRR